MKILIYFFIFLFFLFFFIFGKSYFSPSTTITFSPFVLYRVIKFHKGVYVHWDRKYTYDIVPDELIGSLMVQGIHRLPLGTSIQIHLKMKGNLTLFFSVNPLADGGLVALLEADHAWKKCDFKLSYDIFNGDHGKTNFVYRYVGDKEIVRIGPTSSPRACINVFVSAHHQRSNGK